MSREDLHSFGIRFGIAGQPFGARIVRHRDPQRVSGIYPMSFQGVEPPTTFQVAIANRQE
jgi:hypothetical protein